MPRESGPAVVNQDALRFYFCAAPTPITSWLD
jgi:hypothetical protein